MSRCAPRGEECGVVRELLDQLEGFEVGFVRRGGSIRDRAVFQGDRGPEVRRLLDALQSHYDAHPEEVREMLRRRFTRL